MASTWLSLLLLLGIMALIPLALKWVQNRTGLGRLSGVAPIRTVAAAALGPHQRVVTIEVGEPGARTRLTLGVTPQHITCLHAEPAPHTSEGLSVAPADAPGVRAP